MINRFLQILLIKIKTKMNPKKEKSGKNKIIITKVIMKEIIIALKIIIAKNFYKTKILIKMME